MRKAGILMPVASLPSNYGIGDFGNNSYQFIDLLKKHNVKIWQILPLNPLGYGNSPYQAYSSYAIDEIYISLDLLYQDKLIKKVEILNPLSDVIDYDKVRIFKQKYLKEAFNNFQKDQDYDEFIKMEWVLKYAKFISLKKMNHLKCWLDWDQNIVVDFKKVDYEIFVQYLLFKQWFKLKNYANDLDIEIMGDIPFYVGLDSVDVFENKESFKLDSDGRPIFIAGVPPDYFSETGQRWGNPIYNWDFLKANNFKFWLDRLNYSSKLFDIIRIDHFRAFDTYWQIPYESETAIKGQWMEAPGYDLFDELFKQFPQIKIIAEDLGLLRKEVGVLKDYYGIKGMRVVQFSFDPLNDSLDRSDLVIYTGTHDNQSLKSWFIELDKISQENIQTFFSQQNFNDELVNNFIAYTLKSKADIAIIPMIDLLALDDKARLNTPGTVGNPNWQWKLKDFTLLKRKLVHFKKMLIKYQR